jgi:hypothetical protein
MRLINGRICRILCETDSELALESILTSKRFEMKKSGTTGAKVSLYKANQRF